MTDSGKQRPRRAFAADDAQPDGVDDTRSEAAGRARRGTAGDFGSPFARPGSRSRDTAIPAPVLPGPEHDTPDSPAPTSRWDGLNDETTPHGYASEAEPRHSTTRSQPASVSTPPRNFTWPERKPPRAAAAAPPSPFQQPANGPTNPPGAGDDSPQKRPTRASEAAKPTRSNDTATPSRPEPPARTDGPTKPARAARAAGRASELLGDSWLAHHRRTLTMWVAGAVAAALLIAVGFFLFSRLATHEIASPVAPSSSESSAEPLTLTEDSLVNVADAKLISADGDWNITETVQEPGKSKNHAACLGKTSADVNPVAGMQRTMATTQADKLALMHQVDVYATEEAAKQVYTANLTAMANCADPSAQILSSTAITGLGDEVSQVSVVLQSATPTFHTLLLVRSGRAIHLLDTTRLKGAVAAEPTVGSLTRSLTSLCEATGGTCPTTPGFAVTPPPAITPAGWLIPSDLPRITPTVHSQWTAQPPGAITIKGTGCEGIALDSEPGPDDRQQRTLLMTGDANAPEQMGVDELLFTFANEESAKTFGETLANNLANCAKTAKTAKVEGGDPVTGVGMNDLPVSAQLFNISHQTSDTSSTYFQAAVVTAGNKVVYLHATVGAEYRFSADQFNVIALRAGQRATQS